MSVPYATHATPRAATTSSATSTGRESTGGASLKDQVKTQTTASMKAGDKVTVGALRMLSAAITNREKDLRQDLPDEEVREVAGKEVKKLAESSEAFDAAGR